MEAIRKAGLLLLQVGLSNAKDIFDHLPDVLVEAITFELGQNPVATRVQKESVLQDAGRWLLKHEFLASEKPETIKAFIRQNPATIARLLLSWCETHPLLPSQPEALPESVRDAVFQFGSDLLPVRPDTLFRCTVWSDRKPRGYVWQVQPDQIELVFRDEVGRFGAPGALIQAAKSVTDEILDRFQILQNQWAEIKLENPASYLGRAYFSLLEFLETKQAVLVDCYQWENYAPHAYASALREFCRDIERLAFPELKHYWLVQGSTVPGMSVDFLNDTLAQENEMILACLLGLLQTQNLNRFIAQLSAARQDLIASKLEQFNNNQAEFDTTLFREVERVLEKKWHAAGRPEFRVEETE